MAAFVLLKVFGELAHWARMSLTLDNSMTDIYETDSACPRYYQSERGSEELSWLATDRIAPDGISTSWLAFREF